MQAEASLGSNTWHPEFGTNGDSCRLDIRKLREMAGFVDGPGGNAALVRAGEDDKLILREATLYVFIIPNT